MNDEDQGQQYIDREWEAEKLKAERDHVLRHHEGARAHDIEMAKAKREGVSGFAVTAIALVVFGFTLVFSAGYHKETIRALKYRLNACDTVVQNCKNVVRLCR